MATKRVIAGVAMGVKDGTMVVQILFTLVRVVSTPKTPSGPDWTVNQMSAGREWLDIVAMHHMAMLVAARASTSSSLVGKAILL